LNPLPNARNHHHLLLVFFKMLLYALLALFPILSLAIPGAGCTSIGIITARASTELPGEGVIGSLSQLIQTRSRQTVSRANVDYPALLFPYGTSSATGTAALRTQLTEAVRRCPYQGIVLLGYSQGAHVVGDVLGGGGGTGLGLKTPPVSADVSKKGQLDQATRIQ
jgi:acetylxylan esterase